MDGGIERLQTSDQGTIGRLDLECGFTCWTMELPWRQNQPNISCIPPGKYTAIPNQSPRFGQTYLVTQVQGRSFILTHSGNVGGDRAKHWHTHTQGCILLGRRRGSLMINNRRQQAVLNSRDAFREFLRSVDGDLLELTITGKTW